ncbi:MAG TPA: glycosyltransferase family 2 protein [Ktedonobacteraceae bacterium]|nr:glycosyltransferase family 2 protein [Ktedonobacteraceae bacterium]
MDKLVDICHEINSIGVVIPSHDGRCDLLAKLLESLAADRAFCEQAIDVIVVDDSPPREAARIAGQCSRLSMHYVSFCGNVSQKRNYGASLVRGDLILFLDSDCEVRPGLLAAHRRAYSGPLVAACQGLVTFTGSTNWLMHVIEETPLLVPFASPLSSATVSWGPSANFSVRRSIFTCTGGFDEELSPPLTGGEDVDFGLRITGRGGVIVTAPAAEVWHSTATWLRLRGNVRRFLTWGRGDYYLIKKHPALAFRDIPSFLLTTSLVLATSLFIALLKLSLWPLLAAVIFPLACLLLAGWLHPAQRVSWQRRLYRAGSVLILALLDAGRFLEACKRGEPQVALFRFRFSQTQLFEEWPDLVLTSFCLLVAILLAGVLFW